MSKGPHKLERDLLDKLTRIRSEAEGLYWRLELYSLRNMNKAELQRSTIEIQEMTRDFSECVAKYLKKAEGSHDKTG